MSQHRKKPAGKRDAPGEHPVPLDRGGAAGLMPAGRKD
jgi:hypothetical protein